MHDQTHETYPLDHTALQNYMARILGEPAEIMTLTRLGENVDPSDKRYKQYGYGQPLRIDVQVRGDLRSFVLHTMRPSPFDHQHMADRTAILLWRHRAFNHIPHHARSLDVGGFAADGQMISFGQITEPFQLTEYVSGEAYARDLERLVHSQRLTQQDHDRADTLCDYLVALHQQEKTDASLYERRIRELVGHGECVMGLIDSYPRDFTTIPPNRLYAIEQQVVRWRWRLKRHPHRLRQVHGDFHPWNILFERGTTFHLLDRSRGEWGEPADDVTSLTLNYVFHALMAHECVTGTMLELFERFWDRYLEKSGDGELLEVCAPFVAFRGLVMASPAWYPDITEVVRHKLFRLIESVLEAPAFDPARVREYCGDEL